MGDYGDTVYSSGKWKVEWNGSATFNIYHNGKNVDVWTEYGVDNITDAKRSAEAHMADYEKDADEGHWYTR